LIDSAFWGDDMQVNILGYDYRHGQRFEISRPCGSGDYLLLLLRSKARFVLKGEEMVAEPGTVILFEKGVPQQYRCEGTVFINDWVHFTFEQEEEQWFSGLEIPMNTLIQVGDLTDFSQMVKKMVHERYSVNIHREETMGLYMRMLLLKLSERLQVSETVRPSPYYNRLSEMRSRIYTSPAQKWTVREMAEMMMLSESYFQHLYKEVFGVSVISDVIAGKMEHGKYLLSGTDQTIRGIAQECGYGSDAQFIRQFKRSTGMTPKEYRRQAGRMEGEGFQRTEQKKPEKMK